MAEWIPIEKFVELEGYQWHDYFVLVDWNWAGIGWMASTGDWIVNGVPATPTHYMLIPPAPEKRG